MDFSFALKQHWEGTVMRFQSKFFILRAGVILLMGMALPAHAGWIELNNDGERIVMSKGVFKHSSQAEPTWTLIDMNSGIMTIIDTERKTYTTGTMKEFCATMAGVQKQMMAGMEQALAGMEQAMQGMSPEQRQMMEQMMGRGAKRPDPKVSIRKGARGEVIAGFKTTRYTVSVDGQPRKEVWLTSDSVLMQDLKPYLDKILEMSDMSSCGMKEVGMMGAEFDLENSDEYKKLMHLGYPLREKDIPGGPGRMTPRLREVTSLKRQSIPDSEFALPKGYKKMSFSEMMQQEMGRGR